MTVIAESLERQEPDSYDWSQWAGPIIDALTDAGICLVDRGDLKHTVVSWLIGWQGTRR